MESYETIILQRDNSLLRISLNRPRQLNAFSHRQWSELGDALAYGSSDASVRCIILCGSGGNFSTGYDLADAFGRLEGKPPQALRDHTESGNNVCWAVWRARKPVIAQIEGYCLGGAFELAMACDFVVASKTAKFGEPEVRLADAPPFLISPWILGMRAAKEILLTGDIVDAERADKMGLLTRLCEAADLQKEVNALAQRLAAFPAETWHINKSSINRVYEIQGFQSSIEMGMDAFVAANSNENALKNEFLIRMKRDGVSSALKWVQSRYSK